MHKLLALHVDLFKRDLKESCQCYCARVLLVKFSNKKEDFKETDDVR